MNAVLSLIVCGPVLLMSLVLHELAHAVTADRLGDPTPRLTGRISLDPRRHLDLAGVIVFAFTWLNGTPFGWAKPVRVNPSHFCSPVQGMAIVAAAGPLSNMLQAAFWLGLLALVLRMPAAQAQVAHGAAWPLAIFLSLAKMGVLFNLILAAFNLLPLPPLDGSRIMAAFVFGGARQMLAQLEPYGMAILFLLLVFRVLDPLFEVVHMVFARLIIWAVV